MHFDCKLGSLRDITDKNEGVLDVDTSRTLYSASISIDNTNSRRNVRYSLRRPGGRRIIVIWLGIQGVRSTFNVGILRINT